MKSKFFTKVLSIPAGTAVTFLMTALMIFHGSESYAQTPPNFPPHGPHTIGTINSNCDEALHTLNERAYLTNAIGCFLNASQKIDRSSATNAASTLAMYDDWISTSYFTKGGRLEDLPLAKGSMKPIRFEQASYGHYPASFDPWVLYSYLVFSDGITESKAFVSISLSSGGKHGLQITSIRDEATLLKSYQ